MQPGNTGTWPEIAAADDERFRLGSGTEADPDLRIYWESGALLLDEMLAALQWRIEPGSALAEFGCGAGRLTRPLTGRVSSVVAIDEPAAIEIAREHNPALAGVSWRTGSAGSELAPASVDGFLAYSALRGGSEAEAEATLGALAGALRPGGWGVLQVVDGKGTKRKPSLVTRALIRTSDALIGRRPGQAPGTVDGDGIDLERLDAIAAGLGLVRERTLGEGSPYCLVLLRASG